MIAALGLNEGVKSWRGEDCCAVAVVPDTGCGPGGNPAGLPQRPLVLSADAQGAPRGEHAAVSTNADRLEET